MEHTIPETDSYFTSYQGVLFGDTRSGHTWYQHYELHDTLFLPTWRTKFFILIHLLYSSTCFEHYCAHLQEDNCIGTTSGIVTVFRWLFSTKVTRDSVHRLRETQYTGYERLSTQVTRDELRNISPHRKVLPNKMHHNYQEARTSEYFTVSASWIPRQLCFHP